MECPAKDRKTASDLLAYSAGTLGPERRVLLEQHLAACPECRREVAGQAAVWEALDDWQPPAIRPDFNRRLFARIEKEQARSGWWRHWLGRQNWRRAFSLATACTVLVAMLLLHGPDAPPARHPAKADPVDIEQVERSLDDLEMLQQLSPAAKAEQPARAKSI